MEETRLSGRNWIPHRTPQALPVSEPHIHPSGLPHAVSASLPTWASVVGWSQKNKALLNSFDYCYPRFFICKPLRSLILHVKDRLQISRDDLSCLVFPSAGMARRFMAALDAQSKSQSDTDTSLELHQVRFFVPSPEVNLADANADTDPNGKDRNTARQYLEFSAVIFPTTLTKPAMGFWMDSGAGMTTRHADFCLANFNCLASDSDSGDPAFKTPAPAKFPSDVHVLEEMQFWYGAEDMKEVQTRIAQLTTSERTDLKPVEAKDVWLFPTGMNAIFTASEALAALSLSSQSAVVAYGWLYPETVHVLRKTWDTVICFKWGTDEELDELEAMLKSRRHQITALFCELPSNVKFISPNLQRIRELADTYNFIVACDETAGNFVNLDVLPCVDVVLSSLTKMFSGASDVTGGSIVVNPNSPHYHKIHSQLAISYREVCCFPPDVAILKRNSINMPSRVREANANALVLVEFLRNHPLIEQVLHPSFGPTFPNYERHRRRDGDGGGYGNILSVVFKSSESARYFYDTLDVCKGSSFGTNFTLAIPYVQLACYWTQDKCEKYGLPRHVLRVSVGLEDPREICRKFALALAEVERIERGVPIKGVGMETELQTAVVG